MEVYLSNLANENLKKLSEYLLEEWGLKVKKDFLTKLADKITLIGEQPESCPKSQELKGIYKCVVTKQTTFYYRIRADKNEIEIITLFDSRQDPDKLKEQLE